MPARTSALQGDNSILSQNNKTVNPVPESHQGKKLRLKSAESLLDQYGTIDKPMARSADAIENVQRVADAGFTKPGEVEDIIGKVTGANGKVSKMTQTLVSTAKPVDTMTDISNLINSNTSITGYLCTLSAGDSNSHAYLVDFSLKGTKPDEIYSRSNPFSLRQL